MLILDRFKKSNKRIYKEKDLDVEFVRKSKEKGIGLKSSLVEYSAIRKGMKVDRLSKKIIIVKSGSIQRGFYLMNGEHSSRIGVNMCNNKQDTRYMLKQNGLTVTESKVFSQNEFEKAANYIEEIEYPVVIKPTTLSRGRGITTDIKNINEFQKGWDTALNAYTKIRKNKKVLIEKHFDGEDFRFYVVGDQVVSATHRKRANVTGDGKSSVAELISKKNGERLKNPYLEDNLIPENYSLLERIQEQNINLDYIPKKNQEIILRKKSNVHAGGDNNDVTDIANSGFKDIAVKAIQSIPGIAYGGVDIIAPDITVKPNNKNYIVGEVEFSPAPLAHFPYLGKKRDMAGAVIDYYFK